MERMKNVLGRNHKQQSLLAAMAVMATATLTTGMDWPQFIGPNGDGTRSTPAVSEKYVFIVGAFGHLHCLDRATHQVVWKKNLLTDYGGKSPTWAVAQSPVLHRDLVIVAPQADKAGIVALDQATGQERWRSVSIGPMAWYASIHLLESYLVFGNLRS
jgi:outer membrane protein assembly factor BamB